MPKLTEYPEAQSFDENDILIKDGVNGTKKIKASNAADYMGKNVIMVNEDPAPGTKVVLETTDEEYELALMSDVNSVAEEVDDVKTQLKELDDGEFAFHPDVENWYRGYISSAGIFYADNANAAPTNAPFELAGGYTMSVYPNGMKVQIQKFSYSGGVYTRIGNIITTDNQNIKYDETSYVSVHVQKTDGSTFTPGAVTTKIYINTKIDKEIKELSAEITELNNDIDQINDEIDEINSDISDITDLFEVGVSETLTPSSSGVTSLGAYRIDTDGSLVSGPYLAFQWTAPKNGVVRFTSLGNNTYAFIAKYTGTPSASTYIPNSRVHGSTAGSIPAVNVNAGDVVVFTGACQYETSTLTLGYVYEQFSTIPKVVSEQKVYVSPSGSDSNSGAKDSPFATIAKALSICQNIILLPGTYTEQVSIGNKYNVSICADPTRSSGQEVVFDFDNNAVNGFEIVNIVGLYLADITVQKTNGIGFSIHSCDDVRIDRCSASYCDTEGFSLDNSNAVLYNCIADYSGNDGFNIHGFGNTVFFDCEASYNGRISQSSGDGLSHHNNCTGFVCGGYFHHNAKAGISTPTYGAMVNVSGVFVHDNAVGMQVYGGDAITANSARVKIDNTVFKDNTTGIQVDKYIVDLVNCIFDGNTTDKLNQSGTINEYPSGT